MNNRGNDNLNYNDGFEHEKNSFNKFKPLITKILGATLVEDTSRTIADKSCGLDAYAQIQGNVYGISLRVRENDYNSFTLNRHVTDPASEVIKWIKARKNQIKPAYHIQIAKTDNNTVNTFRINIDAFGKYLESLINENTLENYFNTYLIAYEFKFSDIENLRCVTNLKYQVEPIKLL